tara:strand:+ start:95 stop:376 length:282 start_codon:yes stop_codon:yes gene_type:complete
MNPIKQKTIERVMLFCNGRLPYELILNITEKIILREEILKRKKDYDFVMNQFEIDYLNLFQYYNNNSRLDIQKQYNRYVSTNIDYRFKNWSIH